MALNGTLSAVGLLTSLVGLTGYSLYFEGLESNVTILKVMAIFYILLSIEFLAHHILMNFQSYHIFIHFVLAVTAMSVGVIMLSNSRRYPFRFVNERFRDLIIYGALIWLVDKNLNLNRFVGVVELSLILSSLIIAVLSAYMFLSVRRLRAFFVVDEKIVMATYFVIFLIGESTLCLSVLPLILATVAVVYITYKVFETAKPFIIR